MPPDLVLIIDELPSLNGLDLINHLLQQGITSNFAIISETGSFEVAQKAMRMGVEEYLLKPVDRDEIVRVLKKYAQRLIGVDGRDFNERFLQTKRLLRNSFMDSLNALAATEYFSLEYMNAKYHLSFREGLYQSAIVVVKSVPGDENGEFLESVAVDVRAKFDAICYEMVPYVQGTGRASFIFNYGKDSPVGDMLPELFDIVLELLNKCGWKNAVFCVGIGLAEDSHAKLRRTLVTAERAVRCGMLRGQNKLYSYGKMEFDRLTSIDILTPALLGDLKSSAEAFDIVGFERAVRSAFSPVSYRTDPTILVDICRAAVEAVAEAVKTEDDADGFRNRKEIFDRLGSEVTLADTISALVSWARDLFELRLRERRYVRPVREAIRFIETFCTKPLTLEQVAEQVRLNPAYLCTIFKKETGQYFSEYLIGCRMVEAKRLLRDSDLRIAQICSAVGYADYKHFSKIFAKVVGIKPSAYRALHG